ncbi:hypothetical protein Taro_026888 [Colocasia esculenta]|uniref:VOC domain-containing protein n=1 Tax=Colocasia esculenta TaxID=4460 RepID=A0A843VGG6_COLES|nr:hypothetical protein [Colocasia esculenta]
MAGLQIRCLSSALAPPHSGSRRVVPGLANAVAVPFPVSDLSAKIRKGRGRCVLKATAKASAGRDVNGSLPAAGDHDIGVVSIHHVGILCQHLETSLEFYHKLLGLKINEARPHDKLPYKGAWLWVGSEMIHLMQLPNPDPLTGRPPHGGRDRHACIAIRDVSKLKDIFDKAGIQYTLSRSGRPAIFARDPDGNALEFTQVD